MSVECIYTSYVKTDDVEKIIKELIVLKQTSNEEHAVTWKLSDGQIDFEIDTSSHEIYSNWSVFYQSIKNNLENSKEYVLWCYCDHDEAGVPVLAKIEDNDYCGNILLKNYFKLRDDIDGENSNNFTHELGKLLKESKLKLRKISKSRLKEEYGLL